MIPLTNPEPSIANQNQLETQKRIERPVTRGDCKYGPRPCPWFSCKHHMIWADPKRFAKMADEQILDHFDKAPCSCVLDFVDKIEPHHYGDHKLIQLKIIAGAIGLSKQRINQILHGQHSKQLKSYKGKTYSYSYANPGGAISKFNKRFKDMARRVKP